MTDHENAARRLREANPVPALDGLREDDLLAVRSLLDRRRGRMTAESPTSQAAPRWRRPALAIGAAFMITLAGIGAGLLLLTGGEQEVVATTATTLPGSTTTLAAGTTQPPVATTTSAATTTTTTAATTTTVPPAYVPAMTWERVPDQPALMMGRMNAVVAAGPGLVAVGTYARPEDWPSTAIWVSADGRAWERAATPDAPAEWGMLNDVAEGPGGLVAVGWSDYHASVWFSADGRDWARVEDDDFGGPGDVMMTAVAAGPSGWVAVGGDDMNAMVWVSPDGTSWTRVEDPSLLTPQSGSRTTARMWDVYAGGPGFVAVGWGGGISATGASLPAIWVSPDGLAWERVAETAIEGFADLDQNVQLVGPGPNGGLIAWWPDTQIRYSPDGLTWQRLEGVVPAADGMVIDLLWDGEHLLGFGAGPAVPRVWVSPDGGTTWGSLDVPNPAGVREVFTFMGGITVFGSELIAVGAGEDPFHDNCDRAAGVWIGTWEEG